MEFISKQLNDTLELGKSYGQKCRGGEVFLLVGELGGGKTQFTKGLAAGLGIEDEIISPTFTFERIYENKQGPALHHFDLYRSDVLDPDIAELIKESEAAENVVVIEWAERAKEVWPSSYILINFSWISEESRKLEITEVKA